MEFANLTVFALIGALVLVPLAREYADFRASWALGRLAALSTTLLIVPALAAGLAVGLVFAAEPAAQWTATVVTTLAVYSLAVGAVRGALTPARG